MGVGRIGGFSPPFLSWPIPAPMIKHHRDYPTGSSLCRCRNPTQPAGKRGHGHDGSSPTPSLCNPPLRVVARAKMKREIQKHAAVTCPNELEELLEIGDDAVRLITENVAQARRTDDGNIRIKIPAGGAVEHPAAATGDPTREQLQDAIKSVT